MRRWWWRRGKRLELGATAGQGRAGHPGPHPGAAAAVGQDPLGRPPGLQEAGRLPRHHRRHDGGAEVPAVQVPSLLPSVIPASKVTLSLPPSAIPASQVSCSQ